LDISCKDYGSLILLKLQSLNAASPICVIVFGKFIYFKVLQLAKAYDQIFVVSFFKYTYSGV
jgi:hypothetical protein